MAKRKKYKVGEVVDFIWAGSTERGKILSADKNGKHIIDDGKYTYPIETEKILNVVK